MCGSVMSKYPLCEEVGLKPSLYTTGDNEKLLMASDVEALLLRGVRVYGQEKWDCAYGLTGRKNRNDTHEGILLNYKPISKPKPVTKEELICLINSLLCETSHFKVGTQTLEDLKKRIKDAGVE